MELSSIFLGWLFGMLSPAIVSRIQRKYSKKDLHVGITNELKHIQYIMICTAHLLCSEYGKYDKDFLRWCLPIFKAHPEGEGSENIVKNIEKQIMMPDDQFMHIAMSLRANPNIGKGLKKVNLSFSDIHLTEMSIFAIEFQSLLFELRTQLSMLNEEIDKAEKYFFMTFDSSLSAENYDIVTTEVNNKYVFILNMVVRILEKISKILNFKSF